MYYTLVAFMYNGYGQHSNKGQIRHTTKKDKNKLDVAHQLMYLWSKIVSHA